MASGGPIPELVTADGMTEITFEDFGTEASVSITAMNFEEGADIDYSYEATADFTSMEDGALLDDYDGFGGHCDGDGDRWYVECFAYAYVYGSRSLSEVGSRSR